MPSFRCSVALPSGKVSSVVREAESAEAAARAAAAAGEVLVSVERAEGRSSTRGGRKEREAVREFTEMMGLLTEAGLSLRDALEVASSAASGPRVRALAEGLSDAVRKGSTFAAAVAAADDRFPPLYRGMVAVGDRVGSVEKIFPRLASYLRDRKALSDKVSGALAYPLFVLAVSGLGTLGLVFFLLPRLEAIFLGFGGPAAATIRANVAAMKAAFGVLAAAMAACGAAAAAAAVARGRDEGFARSLDALALRLPAVGSFASAAETLNFAFAMETLASGGVPVEAALAEAAAVVANRAYRAAVLEAREEVLRGKALSAAFAGRKELPPYLARWMAVGERTGQTEKVFSQVRSYFQAEVERRSTRFMALAEPALVALIGGLLLALVVGFVVPLFSMYGSIL